MGKDGKGRSSFLTRVCLGKPLQFSALFLLAATMGHLLSKSVVASSLAIVVLAACVANLGRIAIHIGLGDYVWLKTARIRESAYPTARKQLNALVLGNFTLTMLGLVGGVMWIMRPEAPLLCVLIPIPALSLSFFMVALATVDRADTLELKRGTELVRTSPFGGWLFRTARRGAQFLPIRWLLEVFDDNETPPKYASTLSLLIAVTWLCVPIISVEIAVSHAARAKVVTTIEGLSANGEKSEQGTQADPDSKSPQEQQAPPVCERGSPAHISLIPPWRPSPPLPS